MVIKCPKCGAQNRVPPSETRKTRYRCGKCGTRLLIPDGVLYNRDETEVIPGPLEGDRSADTQISTSGTRRFSMTGVASWFRIRENQLIFSLVLLALLVHLFVIPYAQTPVFDEQYYVREAQSIIHERDVLHHEHPPLAKLFIVTGILVFGDNPWGWRVPSVVFGVASIVIFYFICRRLMQKWAPFLACVLLVFESLTFVMSSVAMLDVFSLTFMLLTFLFYLNDRYVFSGMSLALSALCKLTGVLGIFVVVAHWLIRKRRQPLRNMALFLFAAFIGFIALLPVTDFLATGHWVSPNHLVSQMLHISSSNTFAAAKAAGYVGTSYPWTWVLTDHAIAPAGRLDFLFIISYPLWILIIPSMGYMLYEFIRRKSDVSLFVLLWFGATYLLWIPLVLLTDRATYVYYFYPAVPAVCIGVAFAMTKLWDFASKRHSVLYRRLLKAAIISDLSAEVIFFVFLTPLLREILSALGPSSTSM
jgi:dolichyl-phosphate-mannose-protein mannosyltransferase